MSQAGIDKAAALLLALGEEATAAVFRFLSPLEVSRLGSAMREMEVLPRERVRAILHDYAAEAAEQTGFAADTGRFLDEALKQAFRPERAQALLQRLGAPEMQALEQLAWREPAAIAGLLDAQPPQLIAAMLNRGAGSPGAGRTAAAAGAGADLPPSRRGISTGAAGRRMGPPSAGATAAGTGGRRA